MIGADRMAFVAKLDFATWSAELVATTLAQCGYGGVSWGPAHFDPRRHDATALYRTVAATSDAGLAVSEILGQIDVIVIDDALREDRIRHVEEVIAAAGSFGLPNVNVFTGPAPWAADAARIPEQISRGTAWQMARYAFTRYVRAAERAGTVVAVEPVFEHLVHDFYTLGELIRLVGNENLKVNFDPSHLALYQNDIPWAVRQLGSRIRHVHMKDAIGVPGKHGRHFMFPLLGEGCIDWRSMIGALEEIGYAGFYTVEFEAFPYYRQVLRNDPAEAARCAMRSMRRLIGAERGY